MDFITGFLIQYGYWGMLFAAFLAGSFFPFSSEAVMVGLIAAGLPPKELCVYATIGNAAGGMFNYGVGRMGKVEWIEKYLHVKKKDLDKAERFMAGRGAWMGFFGFLPLLGSAITILLGLMRANIVISMASITIGKALRYILLALGMSAFALTSCTGAHQRQKPVVTVTIEPLRFFVEQIGGDHFKVNTMVPGGSSPETYEPTARQMVELGESQIYFMVGQLGFERTQARQLRANAPQLTWVDTSEGIRPLAGPDNTADPHTWTSPDNAIVIARNIYRALAMADSRDSLVFKENLRRLCSRITQLDRTISTRMAAARDRDKGHARAFVIYHPTLTYFARRYGLEQLAVEENGHEPSAQSLRQLLDKAAAKGARVMLVQKEFSNRNIATVCQGTGIEAKEINPLSYNWFDEMDAISKILCGDSCQ